MANGVNGEVTQAVVKAVKQVKGQEADLAIILLHQVEGWIALDHRRTQYIVTLTHVEVLISLIHVWT